MKTTDEGPGKGPRRRSLEGPVVVAHTTEDDQHPEVRHAAELHAKAHGCVVILYASDVPSLWSEPMPNQWDSAGESEQFGDRLSPEDLDFLGRAALAEQVRESQRGGARASAWLPKDHGIEALGAYVTEQGAHVVFVPASLESIDALRPLLGTPEGDGGTIRSTVEIQVVPAAAPA